jgi:hypothetical protein
MPTTVQAMIDQLCPLDDGRTNDGAQIELAIQANEAAEAGVIDQQEALMSSLDTTRDTAARTALIARVADRQKMIAGLQEERRRLEDQLSGATRGLLGGRLEALREELAGDKKRSDHAARVNLALRALFSKIEIDRPKNEMRFYWRHVPGQFAAVTLDPFAA